MIQNYILILIHIISWAKSEYSMIERTKLLEVTLIKNAPFAVVVILRNNEYFCSGTIISTDLVLTAAHCFFDLAGVFTENDHSVSVSLKSIH